jgi:Tol biopolymer transport system component
MSARRAATLLVVAALTGCTGGAPAGPAGALPDLGAFPGPPGGDRLLVLTDDGALVTVAPDGSDLTSLALARGLEVEVRQPVWSPDGHSVAWAELELGEDAPTSRLVTSAGDGSGRTEYPVETLTFFLQWDPTSSRVAYLGSLPENIGFGVAGPDEDGTPVATTLGRGQPFYLSWAPSGRRLLIHVGTGTLATIDLEGNTRDLGERPGTFQAPVWLDDGSMVYATSRRGAQVLVIRGHGGRARELVTFDGAIEFVVSPDLRRIAYRVVDGSGLGGVSVVDVRTGRVRTATETPTSVFLWSPAGRRLLLMTFEPENGRPTHRWRVWDGERATPIGPIFQPSPAFLTQYAPFYGQYDQTMTLWSPDGRSFAYPGLIGDRAGIWVQELDAEGPDFVLDGGSVVAWSPAPD